MRTLSFVIVFALVLAASPLNGAYLIYVTKGGWETAIGGPYETEDFNDLALNPGISFVSFAGGIEPPVFMDVVSRGEYSTTWTFDTPVRGVGATWDLQRGLTNVLGTGLQITLVYADDDSTMEDLRFELPNSTDTAFYGVVSDIPIKSIIYTGGTQEWTHAAQQALTIDDLVYAYWAGGGGGENPPPGGQVPEPATVMLTALGLSVVAFKARRRA